LSFQEVSYYGVIIIVIGVSLIWFISFVPWFSIQGREIARALVGVDSEEKYLNLMKSKTIPDNDAASRLPFRPDLKYKTEWLGWDDFLIG
jgi:uncharacterized short protein YbdD (DUF466 family)